MDFHDGFNLILLLLGLLVFYRIINGKSDLEFWHLISARSADGKIYVDNDKVGQLTVLIFSTWVICWLTLTKLLTIYFFAAWLLYGAGMGAFAKWARALLTSKFGHPEIKTNDPVRTQDSGAPR